MERITERVFDGIAFRIDTPNDQIWEALNRLVEYEDTEYSPMEVTWLSYALEAYQETGYTPEEIRDLQKSFALACRFISDYLDCPMTEADANFEFCEDLIECGIPNNWECWRRYFLEKVGKEQVCRVCGCTQDHACPPDGCSWVEPDLCSSCAPDQEQEAAHG